MPQAAPKSERAPASQRLARARPGESGAIPDTASATGDAAIHPLPGLPPGALRPRDVLHLQRWIGNQALQRMIGSASAAPAPAGPGASAGVVQRVGGVKVGIKRDDAVKGDDADLREAVNVFTAYKAEIKKAKQDAKAAFTGKEDSIDAQTTYAKALKDAEMNVVKLREKINANPALEVGADNVVKRKKDHAVLARILSGNAAYVKVTDKSGAVVHDLYNKYTPGTDTGLKAGGEYIMVGGRPLRRYGYRGITPVEIEQIEEGGTVSPLFSTDESRAAPQSGMHFTGGVGYNRKNTDDKLDVGYLQTFSNVTKVTPAMYAFVHGRKGVGKFFSLRSTPGDITSNHGESFSSFGEIKLDLAMVAESSFVFHYAAGGAEALESGVPARAITKPARHAEEIKRAKESVLRNREIILKDYPAGAVTWVKKYTVTEADVESKGGEDGYKNGSKAPFKLFPAAYERGYQAGQDKLKVEVEARGYDDGYDGERFAGGGPFADAYKSGFDRGKDDRNAYFTGRKHGQNDKGRTRNPRYAPSWAANAKYKLGYNAAFFG